MKNGQCPKCGSKEIYSGANIPLKSGPFSSNAIPLGLTSMAALDNYVCTACGLVESYSGIGAEGLTAVFTFPADGQTRRDIGMTVEAEGPEGQLAPLAEDIEALLLSINRQEEQ